MEELRESRGTPSAQSISKHVESHFEHFEQRGVNAVRACWTCWIRRLGAALVATAVMGGAVAGCGRPAGRTTAAEGPGVDGKPVRGGVFIEASISDASDLNPILGADTASSEIEALVFDSLYDMDDKLNYHPRLAVSHQWSADNKTLTVKLRKGVKWHDGQPFTSRDVAFTINAIMHPGYTGYAQSAFEPLLGYAEYTRAIDRLNKDLEAKKITQEAFAKQGEALWQAWQKQGAVTTPDDETVVIKLAKVWAPFQTDILALAPIPEHLLKDSLGAKMKDHPFNRKPVGTGRYVFDEWRTKEAITLKANDQYWGGRPNIDRVIVKVVPDVNTGMVALETGEVHYGAITADQFDRFARGVKNVQVHDYSRFIYDYVGWNLTNPLFRQKEVRQALATAVNRKEIVDSLLKGHGSLANSHGSPARWDYNPNVPVFTYDKAKAEAMLDQAGWRKGPDGIRAKDGRRFSFELKTNAGNKRREGAAVIIQQYLKEVGVEVKTRFVDFPVLLKDVDSGNFDAYLAGWSLGPDPHADTIFKTGGSQNDIGYSNKAVDELFDRAAATTDREERKRYYGEIQRLLAEDQPYMWLAFMNNTVGYNTAVKGKITDSPLTAGHLWNMHEWWMLPRRAE